MGIILDDIWMIAAIFVSVAAFFTFLWMVFNGHGYRSRGHYASLMRAKGVRSHAGSSATSVTTGKRAQTDEPKISGKDAKIYRQAKKLVVEQNYAGAAKLFESIGLTQEALDLLEDHDLFRETAQLLVRIQKHERAAFVYARNGLWNEAAECFKIAGKPLEVARCAREAENLPLAAEYFEQGGLLKDAADCLMEAGEYRKAATLFARADDRPHYIAAIEKLYQKTNDCSGWQLEQLEIDIIVSQLIETGSSTVLENILQAQTNVADIVRSLLEKDQLEIAENIYQKSMTSDTIELLLTQVPQMQKPQNLAQMFVDASDYGAAGKVYEALDQPAMAASMYEKGHDTERAIFWYEKAGDLEKAKSLHVESDRRKRVEQQPSSIPEPPASELETGAQETEVAECAPEPKVLPVPSPIENIESPPATVAITPSPPPPPVEAVVESHQVVRLNGLREVFNKIGLVDTLDDEQKAKVWSIGATTTFASGDIILTYDDEPEGIYVVLSGSVNCYRRTGDERNFVDRMGPGKVFGELWLLADQATTVQFVAAQKNTKIHIVRRGPFQELLDNDGTIARKIYKRFTMRLLKHLINPHNHNKNSAVS